MAVIRKRLEVRPQNSNITVECRIEKLSACSHAILFRHPTIEPSADAMHIVAKSLCQFPIKGGDGYLVFYPSSILIMYCKLYRMVLSSRTLGH